MEMGEMNQDELSLVAYGWLCWVGEEHSDTERMVKS